MPTPNIFAQRTLERRRHALESLVAEGAASITGTVRRIGAGSRVDGSWVTGDLVADDGATVIPFVGRDLIGCEAGRPVRLDGVWRRHASYGLQFEATSVQTRLPSTVQGIARYLTAHVAGLGPTRAMRLANSLGPATLDILADTPERILAIFPGKIGETLLAGILRWREIVLSERRFHTGVQKSLDAGAQLGIARKISRHFGAATESTLLHHPYRLVEVSGIGFKTADSIARQQGARIDDPARIAAGVVHALGAARDQGDSALPHGVLVTRAIAELTVEHIEPEALLVEQAIALALESGTIVDDHGLLFLPEVRDLEIEAAERLAVLQRTRRVLSDSERARVETVLAKMAEGKDPLTGAQRAAVMTALESGVSVLTGRPGAGKTTTVRTVLECADALGWIVNIAAPSGKAAARAAEVTGKKVTTVHVMIGTQPLAVRDIPFDCNMIVIDEASMADLELAVWVLRNIDPEKTILFIVGDNNQLPSVAHGRVLGDCIDSGVIPTTALTQIFRQGANSRIVQNAHRLLDGQPLLIKYEPFSDFIFADVTQAPTRGPDGFPVDPDTNKRDRQHSEAIRRMNRAISDFLVGQRHADPAKDIQVLSPMRVGPLGTEALNMHLQALLNPTGRSGPMIGARAIVRVGDRVIQTKNDYAVPGHFLNGQQGMVLDHGSDWVSVSLEDGRVLRLQGRQLLKLRLAWAITVHRSQGSEFPYVITMCDMSHARMLERALLYTAITRARKVCILIGELEALTLIRRRANKARPRYTALADRLREAVCAALEAAVGTDPDSRVS